MRYFCTYFDGNYVPRALALHRSLRRYAGPFTFYALCMDDPAYERMSAAALPNVVLIRLEELEKFEARLRPLKEQRTRVEYYYTCGPTLIRYVFAAAPEVDLLTYLDADLYFFSSPEPLFAMLGDGAVGLIEHRFSPRHQRRLQFGRFNVGWLSFRRNDSGLAALEWWSDRCIEWCFDRVEGDRYADQKYLDSLPVLFSGVRILDHIGANVAPWNYANYAFRRRDGRVFVDDVPLVFFHFHGVKELAPWLIDSNLARSFRPPRRVLRRDVFGRYVDELRDVSPDAPRTVSRRGEGARVPITTRLKNLTIAAAGVLTGSYLLRIRGRIL